MVPARVRANVSFAVNIENVWYWRDIKNIKEFLKEVNYHVVESQKDKKGFQPIFTADLVFSMYAHTDTEHILHVTE